MREALETLELLAGFPSGRDALLRAGLPSLLGSALAACWLKGRAVGLARALRDELLQAPAWGGSSGGGSGGGGGAEAKGKGTAAAAMG